MQVIRLRTAEGFKIVGEQSEILSGKVNEEFKEVWGIAFQWKLGQLLSGN